MNLSQIASQALETARKETENVYDATDRNDYAAALEHAAIVEQAAQTAEAAAEKATGPEKIWITDSATKARKEAFYANRRANKA